MRFKDHCTLITGAAKGIGLAIARRFASEGSALVLWDVDSDGLTKAARELEKSGTPLLSAEVDVSNADAVATAFEAAETGLGPIDIVINNAGINRDAPMHKLGEEAWDQVIDVNLKGSFLVGREAGRRLKTRGTGVILNNASIVGLHGNIAQSNYAASKGGVIAMTKTWAKELGKFGVRVNAVAPGFTETEMLDSIPAPFVAIAKERCTLKRLGRPEEIAAVFAFLASEDASFINGQVIVVDGGVAL